MNVITLIIIYLAVINFISFTVMGIDKLKARKRAWRIPEATLFVLAVIGGSVGSIIGMHLFRHKTRHWYFLYGMPAILLVQVLIYDPVSYGSLRETDRDLFSSRMSLQQ